MEGDSALSKAPEPRGLDRQLEGGAGLAAPAPVSLHGEALLLRLKNEALAKLQLQREMTNMAQENLENQFQADRLALEVESLKQEKCVLLAMVIVSVTFPIS